MNNKTPRLIPTEDACTEQWRMLMRFSYESNIQRFWGDGKSGDADTLSLITGSIRQSHAYFLAGAKAPMDIAPLLFYYGFTNLLWGVAALLGAERLPIKSHGMRLIAPVANASTASTYSQKLENWNVRPASWNDGGLHLLCKVFSDGCVFPSTSTVEGENDWNLGELFGSFLDLRDDVFACYGSDRIYAVPIEIVRHQGILFDRVTLEDMNPGTSYQEQIQVFSLVEKFRSAYLMPQSSDGSHVVLKPKLGGVDIVSYSLFGNRFLALSHLKSNNLVCPSPIITLLMTLFALGYLSRYHPEIWNRFVRNDESGERMIVERFLSLVYRFGPNLVLNHLMDERIVFTAGEFQASSTQNTFAQWDDNELKKFVREQANEVVQANKHRN